MRPCKNNGLAVYLSPPARMDTISTKTPCARNPPDIGKPATRVSPGFLVVKISIMGFRWHYLPEWIAFYWWIEPLLCFHVGFGPSGPHTGLDLDGHRLDECFHAFLHA